MDTSTVTSKQPFNLPLEITWVISIVLPIIIAFIGWIIVYMLNKKSMRNEKVVVIRLEAYNYIKDNINSLEKNYSHLYLFIFMTFKTLSDLTRDNILYDINKRRLLNEYDNNIFNDLKDKASISFNEFIYKWGQYELIFKPIVIQKYALEEEFVLILDELTNLWGDYDRYFQFMKTGLKEDDSYRTKLAENMNNVFDHILDFSNCITDVSFNIQNLVFSDITKNNIEKRIVEDEKYLTIDKLIVKHKDNLQKTYKINL